MPGRERLHKLVDALPERDLQTAGRVLEALALPIDPVAHSLETAPVDSESDDDDFDGGLTEARREAKQGRLISHSEVKRELGLE